MIAFDVRHYDSIGSTNDEAMRLAREGAAHGTVVHADEQTAGRGRLSRRWLSPPGNLYLSIVLRPDVPTARSVEIGLVAALAVADAVDALLPQHVRATLKWPNDVLVHDGKIAGISAGAGGRHAGCRHWSELSCKRRVAFRTRCQPSSAAADWPLSMALARNFCQRWRSGSVYWQQEGFPPIRASWLARAHPIGATLRVRLADRLVIGRFAGIDEDGALLLDAADGRTRIVAGDVQAG